MLVKKILKALKTIASKLGADEKALDAAKAVYTREHDAAHTVHAKEKKAQAEADKLRRQGHPKKADAKDRRAANLRKKREDQAVEVEKAVGEVKRLTQVVHGLEKDQTDKQAELVRYQNEHGVKVTGDKATGGTKRQRIVAIALAAAAACSAGRRRNFYSQSGAWDVNHPVTGEHYGERSDCSSFVTSVYKAAGVSDPNGTDFHSGYTGTLAAHGRSIPESKIRPGDLVLYGTAPFHHVELYVGPGSKTIGHGSPPVDAGVIHLLPGPIQIRSYIK